MFDFLSSDWFNIGLEIVFLLFIIYDTRLYLQTKKKEYLMNIALTIGFFIWTMIPFYNEYITWKEEDRNRVTQQLVKENNATLGECLSGAVFKEYRYEAYKEVESKKYETFLKEAKEECLDDSWF